MTKNGLKIICNTLKREVEKKSVSILGIDYVNVEEVDKLCNASEEWLCFAGICEMEVLDQDVEGVFLVDQVHENIDIYFEEMVVQWELV